MTDTELTEVYLDLLFPEVDSALRQGKHFGTEGDPFVYDFLSRNEAVLTAIFERYRVAFIRAPEGYFYVRPHDSDPAPLGYRHLPKLDMLVGLTLSGMYLDPEWLETGRRIPEPRILAQLEQVFGSKRLLRFIVARKRGHDDEKDAEKLRESYSNSLRTLERLGFIRREGRRGEAVVIPLSPIMRFADPVRSSGPTQAAINRLLREGEIEEVDEDRSAGALGD